MSFDILKRCLLQLFSSWKTAVKLSGIWLVLAILVLALGSAFGVSFFEENTEDTYVTGGPSLLTRYLIGWGAIMFLAVVGTMSVAIGWHRFILRKNTGAKFGVFQGIGILKSYLWRSVKMFVVLFLTAVPFFIASYIFLALVIKGGPLETSALSGPNLFFFFLVGLALSTVFMWISLRIGLILPAIAVGQSMTIAESFNTTKSLNSDLFIAAFLMALLQNVPDIPWNFVSHQEPTYAAYWIAGAFSFAFSWINFFVGIGVLTVLYGHLKEGKPL